MPSQNAQYHTICLSLAIVACFPAAQLLPVRAQEVRATAAALPPPVGEPAPGHSARSRRGAPQEPEIDIPIGSSDDRPSERVPVYINLSIPHQSSSTVTSACAYPYPMPPPRNRFPVPPLSTRNLNLKNMIRVTGYTGRSMAAVAYPYGGWRWQYAYKRALGRSGRSEPHLIGSIYIFADELLPYVKEEVLRTNAFEDERVDRYQRAVTECKETRADAETESVRKGFSPIVFQFNRMGARGVRQGALELGPGQWWIVCTHKIPGLTYYWQIPITVHTGEPMTTTLDEDNALLIEGAW